MVIRQLFRGGAARLIVVTIAAALAAHPVISAAQTHEDSPLWGKPEFDNPDDIEDPAVWKEILASLPAYPEDSDLVSLNLPSRGDRYATYIDGKTLEVGEDSVVRYTVVIRSSSGVDNVIVEGIRCTTREYREYAYGTSGNELEPVVGRGWRMIGQPSGAFAYRLVLSERYACKYDRNPYTKETILKRIAGQSDPSEDFLNSPF